MTKKFWANWKSRVGETKAVWRWVCPGHATWMMTNYDTPHRFISFDFIGENVIITYEVLNWVIGPNGGHNHSEIHRICLNRTDIKTVEFKG